MEAVFSHLKGVTSVVSGFEGGRASADYETVSTGTTAMPNRSASPTIRRASAMTSCSRSFSAWPAIPPSSTGKAGRRPAISHALVPIGPEQARVARAYLAQLKALKLWKRPIVTRIEPWRGILSGPAEHQDFAFRNPRHPYIPALGRGAGGKRCSARSRSGGNPISRATDCNRGPQCLSLGHGWPPSSSLCRRRAGFRRARGADRFGRAVDRHARRCLCRACRAERPASAYDIAESVGQRRGKRVAANSVYRILDLFVRTNLARRVESANAYVANSHPAAADCIFLICDACGQVTHIDNDRLTGHLREAAREAGFADVRPVVAEIRGRCQACAA
jgi:Fur family zinc uptake transcriptional regulator